MRVVTCKKAELAVAERPVPTPGEGQVLVDVVRCGICGSDLHARHHADDLAAVAAEIGYDGAMRSDQEVVFGHEFSGTIVEYGPKCRKSTPAGSPVVALPLLRQGGGVHPIGLSASAPGAYAEQLLIQEALMLPVPNGLAPDTAALTEPMAVGWHAVCRSEIKKRDVAIVIGCGPVGLAVVAMLKARGVSQVIASDLSPGRRALASRCGADVVVDPAKDSPYAGCAELGHMVDARKMLNLALDGMERLRRFPAAWQIYRVLDGLGAVMPKRPVVFECVGVPGIIEQIITSAPGFSRIVVVGVCMGEDRIRPAMAINKEIDLRFVLGYTPLEFRDTLHMLAEGKVDARPLVTGTVGLPGVDGAFTALRNPEIHAKILIDPKCEATEPTRSP